MYKELLIYAYIASVIYAFFRLRSLISPPFTKAAFTVLFLIVMLSLPAAEILSREKGLGWLRPDSSFGYYFLAYVLYVPLAVLAMDFLLALNFGLKIVPSQALRSPGARTAGLVAVLIVPLIVVIAGSINYNIIRIARYHIEVLRGASKLEHLRIAMAADFHLSGQTKASFITDFLAKIEEIRPDIILIPGDLYESRSGYEGRADIIAAFRSIKTKYGIYASPGNHDGGRPSDGPDFYEDAGIRLLADEIVRIDDAFYLAGRKDDYSRRRKGLAEFLSGAGSDLPIFMMSHRPSRLADVGQSPVAVQVSGHTHDGQLFPLNIGRKIQYGLAWGHKKIGNTHVFVTSGIQGWGPRVRTAGHSEIMVIDVVFVK